MSVEKVVSDTAYGVARAVRETGKRVWSELDAAAEKPTPNQYLSPKTIRTIQGHGSGIQQSPDSADR